MKLILHIGTHKTGTTAIQRFLALNQVQMLKLGIGYPKYSDILPGHADHYAHIDVAKGLMGESRILSTEDSKLFLQGLRCYGEKHNCHTVVVSAESFMRGMLGSRKKKWTCIENFVKEVRKNIKIENVEVSICLRGLSSYLPSLYNEHVKVTGYTEDIIAFHSQFRERFNFPLIIETWGKHFPRIRCVNYETLGGGRTFIENWVNYTCGVKDFTSFDFSDGPRNISWPLELVAIKRELNKFLTGSGRANLRKKITKYIELQKHEQSAGKKLQWLTQEEMGMIVSSHEKEYKSLLPNFGVDVDLLLKNEPISKELVFKGLKEENYLKFIKYLLEEKNNG